MRFCFLLLLPALFGCTEWKYYAPTDASPRKSQALDLTVGRFFTYRRSACVSFRLISWNNQSLKIPREVLILEAGGEKLPIIEGAQAVQTAAFQRALRDYYGKTPDASDASKLASEFYAPETLELTPKVALSRMLCYRTEDAKEPYSFKLEGVQVNGQNVSLKPFEFKPMQRPQ